MTVAKIGVDKVITANVAMTWTRHSMYLFEEEKKFSY